MTRYYTNFEDSEVGKFPRGWTRRWLAATTANHEVEVAYATVPVKRRALLSSQATASFRGLHSYDVVDGTQNIEILTCAKRVSGSPTWYVYARGTGTTDANCEAYMVEFTIGGSTTLRIRKFVAAVASNIASVAISTDNTKAYYIRFSVQDLAGSPSTVALKVRIWAEDEDEPTTWTAEGTDASFFGVSGFAGVENFGASSSSHFNFFSVRTGGDTAWKPKTNDEYTTWLSEPTARPRTLVDLYAVGSYNSNLDDIDDAVYSARDTAYTREYLNIPSTLGSPAGVPATTPDAAVLDIVGDLDFRFDLQLDSYTSAAGQYLISKMVTGTTGVSYGVYLGPGGALRLVWSADGTTVNDGVAATSAELTAAISAGQRVGLRATLDINNETGVWQVRGYYAPLDPEGAALSGWIPFVGNAFGFGSAATSVFSGTGALVLGARADGTLPAAGRIYRAQVYNGIDGTLVADFNPNGLDPGYTEGTQSVSGLNATTDVVETLSIPNSFDSNTQVMWTSLAPGGVETAKWYWVVNPTSAQFQIALTRGGSALDLTNTGLGVGDPLYRTISTSHSAFYSPTTGELWTVNSPSTLEVPLTYAIKRLVPLSDGRFATQEWDDPATDRYRPWLVRAPKPSRQMNIALSGKADVGFGTVDVSNPLMSIDPDLTTDPDSPADLFGERDLWLRTVWVRDYAYVWHGDETWAKHDFRLQLVARLGQPFASAPGIIRFPLTDLLDLLDRPLQENRFATGTPFVGQRKPLILGKVALYEPTPTNTGGTEFHVNDGPVYVNTARTASDPLAYDNGTPLQGTLAGASVSIDTGTDTITYNSHGLSNNAQVMWPINAPAGIFNGNWYWVINVTTNTFQISTSRGGSAHNITGTSAFDIQYRLYYFDQAAGQLVKVGAAPTRLVLKNLDTSSTAADQYPAAIIDHLVFTKYGLSLSHKDVDTFDALATAMQMTCGLALFDDSRACLEILHEVCTRLNLWYEMSPDGRLRLGRLDLPSSTAVMSFEDREIKDMALDQVFAPVDWPSMEVRYAQTFYRNGKLQLLANYDLNRDYLSVTPEGFPANYVVGSPSDTFDNHPNLGTTRKLSPMNLLLTESANASTERTRVRTMYLRKMGRFSFSTRAKARELNIGDTIQVTSRRFGWKAYDNVNDYVGGSAYDARNAVVIGIENDLSPNMPFPVRLTVYRPLPGHYPVSDSESGLYSNYETGYR